MKKSLLILILAVGLGLLSACGAETASSGKAQEPEATASVVDEQLAVQQAEFDNACSLLESGDLDEAERILSGLDRIEEAGDKLQEIEQLRLRKLFEGSWILADFSGAELVLSADGSGTLQDSSGTAEFTFTALETGISTDLEDLSELQLTDTSGVRTLTAGDRSFYAATDLEDLPEPEMIEITAENWEEYFEIITECFAQNWDEDNNLAYYAEILYFFPKAEIRERMSPFHSFQVSFSTNYDHIQRYVGVDKETFMPITLRGAYEKLGNYDSSCVLNSQALWRIETNNILYSDGFAHQSLRDGEYIRYARYYDTAENIKVKSVEGSLYLLGSSEAD